MTAFLATHCQLVAEFHAHFQLQSLGMENLEQSVCHSLFPHPHHLIKVPIAPPGPHRPPAAAATESLGRVGL